MEKNALVLSGGSIKGAFQAGAIEKVLEKGFKPDMIYGTSVGSLNGGFLTNLAGKTTTATPTLNWPQMGKDLVDFWINNITGFKKIGKKRNFISLGCRILFNRFDGLINTAKLRKMVKEILDETYLKQSPVEFYACSVNVADGKITYAKPGINEKIIDFIIASTAIPLVMPLSIIEENAYLDGGIREVAPLGKAIDDGAQEIVCIVCQPREMEKKTLKTGKLIELSNQIMDIVTDELVNNDIKWLEKINTHIEKNKGVDFIGPFSEKKIINLTVIRPDSPLNIELTDFNPEQITELIQIGREIADRDYS